MILLIRPSTKLCPCPAVTARPRAYLSNSINLANTSSLAISSTSAVQCSAALSCQVQLFLLLTLGGARRHGQEGWYRHAFCKGLLVSLFFCHRSYPIPTGTCGDTNSTTEFFQLPLATNYDCCPTTRGGRLKCRW